MYTRIFRRTVGFILAALMLSSTILLAPTAVEAQRRVRRRVVIVPVHPYRYRDPFWRMDQYRYNQYVFDTSDKAYNEGYKDGRKTGEKDGKKNKSYDPERSHYFKEAGFGNFAEAYRDGFSRGYQDGYGSRLG